MLLLIVLSVAAALIAGLVVKAVLDRSHSERRITRIELLIGMGIISLVVAPLTSWAGWSIAKKNLLSFRQYRNGWEKEAVEEVLNCSRDGPCIHEYDCDPYRCEPHECKCVCISRDQAGNCTSQSCDTCWNTCYHDCPYATREFTYTVRTTIGEYTIGAHHFAAFPIEWRAGSGLPEDVPRGAPQFWLQAEARIDAGSPGPATKRVRYDNYILASERTILKQYSSMIEDYREGNLLPPIAHRVRDFYYADKVSFVGFSPRDEEAWQQALMYLNAALGSELEGDLHLVIVQDATVSSNPDAYILALKAYWQDSSVWGDNCLSKNAIVAVLGTRDGQTVSWARAETGMPLGNEHMRMAIRSGLEGIELTPQAVLGDVRGELYTREKDGTLQVRSLGRGGVLWTILWGLADPATRFVQTSMTGDDPGSVGGGFLYLNSEVQPRAGQKVGILVMTFFLSCFVWVVFAFAGETRRRRRGARTHV